MTITDESGIAHTVEVRPGEIVVDGRIVGVRPAADGSVRILGESESVAWVAAAGDARWVFVNGEVFTFTTGRRTQRARAGSRLHESLTAPMPATVVTINVKPGDSVRRGEVIVVLEAMKMELPVRSPAEGRIVAVNCREGELVQPGVSLVEIED